MKKRTLFALQAVIIAALTACGQSDSIESLKQSETDMQQSEEMVSDVQESEEDKREVIVYDAETLAQDNILLEVQADNILSLETQKLFQEEIDRRLAEKTHSFEEPLVIYNPYGTNSCAVNFYFTTEEETEISYVIHVEGFSDYGAVLYNGADGNYTTEHAYQITGFLPGYVNEVTLIASDGDRVLYEKTFKMELPASDGIQIQITKEEGESAEELSEGLFYVSAKGTNYNGASTLYDNNGILRSVLTVEGYRSDNILFTDNSAIYPIGSSVLGEFDRLGQMINRYELGNYNMHHDIAWLEEGQSILVLVTDGNAGSLEDQLIQLNLENGEISLLVDFRELLPEVYQLAIENRSNAENYLGNDSLDWLHLNSIVVIDEDSVLVSARELSAVIKVDSITTEPALAYIIGSDVVFEGTEEANALLRKTGESLELGGQHSLVYSEIDENSYYLSVYNNNLFWMESRTDVSADDFPDSRGNNYYGGTNSYYMKYQVNELDGTYELIQSIPVEYSSIMGGVQSYDSNIVISSAFIGVFYEYDCHGALVAKYSFNDGSFCYRTFKVSMNGFGYS